MIQLDDNVPGCKNFKWHELLFLNGVGACVYVDKSVENNLIEVCKKLQEIRDYYGRPIKITSAIRPKLYNAAIKGSPKSAHIDGMAIDFKVQGLSCDRVRKDLEPMLERLEIRMENLPKSNWIHIDTRPVGKSRFFRP